MSGFPYDGIGPHQSWHQGVSAHGPEWLDPHQGMAPRFRFDRQTLIASAGSCFALRLAESLREFGFNYADAEPGPAWLPPDLRAAYHYREYSARYGHVYSALQFQQLLARAYGDFEPLERYWQGPDGLLDPFRPRIQPEGFASEAELDADRRAHFAAVRQVCESAEIFVFTLGLTELWRDRRDGAVYPACPGRGHGVYDSGLHVFHNAGLSENLAAMHAAIERLHRVNPALKILLTVSPVPLAATYEPRHVLQSTVYSKSLLRVLAQELCAIYPFVDYFAAYEIVTAIPGSRAFESDRRTVSPEGVKQVLSCFYRHFADRPFEQLLPVARPEVSFAPEPCDEEELLRYLDREFDA